MEYNIDELLPIVAKLTDKYTSKESSSVKYETARMIMEAIVYCIDECFQEKQDNVLDSGDKLCAEVLYEKGYEIVINKVLESKKIYDSILEDFKDYDCINYRDTILKGMPEFFMRYDAKFNPQNHILTLDYPLIYGNPKLCGIDLILEYLKGIKIEKYYINYFDKQTVVAFMNKFIIDFKSLYLDNLCYPILLNTIGCVIAEKPIDLMKLNEMDYKDIKFYFEEDDINKINQKVCHIIKIIENQMLQPEGNGYLKKIASGYSSMIFYGIQNHSLENVIMSL